jgi:hypothetical protein
VSLNMLRMRPSIVQSRPTLPAIVTRPDRLMLSLRRFRSEQLASSPNDGIKRLGLGSHSWRLEVGANLRKQRHSEIFRGVLRRSAGAADLESKKEVVLKVLPAEASATTHGLFWREARLLSRLAGHGTPHPHILPFFGLVEEESFFGGRPMLVSPYVEAKGRGLTEGTSTVASLVSELRRGVGLPVRPARTSFFFVAQLAALPSPPRRIFPHAL